MSGKVTILPKQTPIVRVSKKHTPDIDVRHEQRFIDCKAYTETIHNATDTAYRSK